MVPSGTPRETTKGVPFHHPFESRGGAPLVAPWVLPATCSQAGLVAPTRGDTSLPCRRVPDRHWISRDNHSQSLAARMPAHKVRDPLLMASCRSGSCERNSFAPGGLSCHASVHGGGGARAGEGKLENRRAREPQTHILLLVYFTDGRGDLYVPLQHAVVTRP